jgi:hypothetical protein
VVLIGCGVVWQLVRPGRLDSRQVRAGLTGAVYYLFLPALVLRVIWQAPLGLVSVHIALLAAIGVLAGIAMAWLVMRVMRVSAAVAGACILAAAWPNATYVGLPVLEAVFGELGRSTAIQYDLFACTPLLLTLGIVLARHYGTAVAGVEAASVRDSLFRVPPLWAAVCAILLNTSGVVMPGLLEGVLGLLGNAVVPLMLFALGLSLHWQSMHWRQLPVLLPVLLIQLLLMPLLVWGAAAMLGLQDTRLDAVVLEAAMPSMVLGLVFCDRYGLDTGFYAAAVTLSTVLSLLTLPAWYSLLS